ncbi:MAG: glycosyltransferase [Candidatus Coatesbacteria bacterium]
MTAPLRVLVAGPTYVIGANQAKWAAVARLGGTSVGLLVPEAWPNSSFGMMAELECPYPELEYFPTRTWLGTRGGLHLYPPATVVAALRAFRPDFVHVELESFALGALELGWLARRAGIPYGLFCWENTDRRLSPPRRMARGAVLRDAACAIAGNREAADLLVQWGLRGPVDVLPQMGVDVSVFSPRPAPPAPPFVIGYLGRLVPEKGIDLLLEALGVLRGRGVDARLIVQGGGPAERDLRGRSDRLGLGAAVEWRAAAPHGRVPDILASLHVLVLPSRSVPGWKEQFGHVLIEAMAMGIPVVGSTCGEIPRVIGREDAVFPEGDAGALARLLERACRDDGWRAGLAQAGVSRVRENYTHEKVARAMVRLWTRVLGREQPSEPV